MGFPLEHVDEPAAVPPAGRNGSALDKIRALYQKAQGAGQTLDLPIPRNPILGVRYRAIDPDEYTSKATRSRDQQLDLLIAACESIVIREGDGWEPLEYDGEPVRFDETFSELAGLGVPPVEQGGTARQVALAAFGTAPVPALAVALHVDRLTDWMAGVGQVDEEELLGES
jgi:hypothetical protein